MRREAKNCLYCNKPFFIDPNHTNQIYCSIQHRKTMWKKRHWRQFLDSDNLRRRKKSYKPEQKKCLLCKNEFWTSKFNPNQIYCSLKCGRKIYYPPKKRRITRKIYRNNHLEEIKKKDVIYKSKIRFGVTSKTLNKKIVLKRDNKTCRLCKKPYQVVHHIKYSGKVEDLVALCWICHNFIHRKIKKPPFWIGNYKFKEI